MTIIDDVYIVVVCGEIVMWDDPDYFGNAECIADQISAEVWGLTECK